MEMLNKVLVTPFLRQCYVTVGVTLNVMCFGLVSGYASVLLPQLRQTKDIELEDESLSWFASIIGFSIIVGALIGPSIMSRKGRRIALITCSLLNIIGWILCIAARNMSTILVARLFQGLSLGVGGVAAHVTIGEYTSPRNRGAFLVLHPFSMFFGSMAQHVQGVYLTWRVAAGVSLIINSIGMLVVILSPETPSFLATKKRFESCKESFHWLRGYGEDDELEKMIKAAKLINNLEQEKRGSFLKIVRIKINLVIKAIKKKEFYKSVILVMHLQLLNLWSGSLLNESYATEIFTEVFGNFNKMYIVLWSLDAVRMFSSALSMIVVHRMTRRRVIIISVLLNIAVYVSIAGYVYGKRIGLIPQCNAFGIILLHMHYLTIGAGCSLMPNIIAGEIYPLAYRGICGMISTLSFSTYLIIKLKTVPFLFKEIGLHGAYLTYAGVVGYSLIVLMSFLPETKDKTLQDIENEFKGIEPDCECVDKMIEVEATDKN